MRSGFLAAVVVSTLASAQTTAPVVRALPKIATDNFTGGGSFSIPAVAFRAEYWFSGSELPVGAVVGSIGMRGRQGSSVAAQTRTMAVYMANVNRSFAGVSANFAQNLGPNPVTFFAKKPISFPGMGPGMDPNRPLGWIAGDQPFPFAGPNLVMDFRVEPSTSLRSLANDGLVLTAAQSSLFSPGRAGCGRSLIGKYSGSDILLTVTQVPPMTGVIFNLGLEDLGLISGQPVDLSAYGLVGCHLGTAAIASGVVTADASGRADLRLPYGIVGPVLSFVVQGIHAKVPVPVTPGDYATTNTLNVALGYQGMMTALFALGSAATVAQQGPAQNVSGVVFLLR